MIEACRRHLRALEVDRLDDQYQRGYEQTPENVSDVEALLPHRPMTGREARRGLVGRPAGAGQPPARARPLPRPRLRGPKCTVALLTTTARHIPVEVPLTPADGVPKECVVNADLLTTIPKSALTSRITTLSAARLNDVEAAIKFALDLT